MNTFLMTELKNQHDRLRNMQAIGTEDLYMDVCKKLADHAQIVRRL